MNRLKSLFCLITLLVVGATSAEARKASLPTVIQDAVEDFAESRASITLPAKGGVEIAFSPNGGCTAATVRFIGEAKHSVRMAAYGLTSNPIGKALVEAKKRGVDVRVVVDREHNGRRDSPNSVVSYLVASGIPVRIDTAVKIQHNKIIIVDGEAVQNGSFNFTSAAQTSNAENIIIHRNFPELARVFATDWNNLWAQSNDYRSKY